jgi:cell division protein FtsB
MAVRFLQVVELSSSISGAQSERDAIATENLALESEVNELLMSIQPLRDTISEKERSISDLEVSHPRLPVL